MSRPKVPVEERFWTKVRKTRGCWYWTGALRKGTLEDGGGYGRIWDGEKTEYAHRVAWELEHGPIPPKFTVDHLCRNRACVRTSHMELVTRSENRLRSPGSNRNKARCKRGHRLAGKNVQIRIKANGTKERVCLECIVARAIERRDRLRG